MLFGKFPAYRLAKTACLAMAALLVAANAHALVIDAGFATSITSASNAAQIESSIDTAVGAIENLYGDPGTVHILFTAGSGSFLGQSQNAEDIISYNSYTSLLQADAASHPSNTILATALANLHYGTDANGARPIAVTTALLRVGLGFSSVTPCFNSSGSYVSGCNATYDGVITLSTTNTLGYTRPISSGVYDAVSVIEHEVDEILGGGGAGSTLNTIAADGSNNSRYPLSYADGPLDLYRYSGVHTPSFTTSSSAKAWFSVDGGVTDIARFNQTSSYDYGDFYYGGCPASPDYVQDAVGCKGQMPNVSLTSPEYPMMLAIGYDPLPEPASIALLGSAVAGLAVMRRRSGRQDRVPQPNIWRVLLDKRV